MSIPLNRPYIIIPSKLKRYQEHYHLPLEGALVVPVRSFGSESSCDVRWWGTDKEQHFIHNVVFIDENLSPMNFMLHDELYRLWLQHYQTTDKILQ